MLLRNGMFFNHQLVHVFSFGSISSSKQPFNDTDQQDQVLKQKIPPPCLRRTIKLHFQSHLSQKAPNGEPPKLIKEGRR